VRVQNPAPRLARRRRPRRSPTSSPTEATRSRRSVTSENIVSLNFDGVDYDAPVLATVNGEKIDQTTFRNRLILSQGFLELDQHLTYLLTKRRIEAAAATGADPKQYLVSDDEVRKAYEEMKASIPNVMQGMKSEDWEKQVKDYMGLERYLEMLKVNLSFAKIFLPPVQKPADDDRRSARSTRQRASGSARLHQGAPQARAGRDSRSAVQEGPGPALHLPRQLHQGDQGRAAEARQAHVLLRGRAQ
jgi:hypothetical protein